MDKLRYAKLAGVNIPKTILLNEVVEGDRVKQLADAVYLLAEETAHTESGEDVSGDKILEIADAILSSVKDGVADQIHTNQ